MAIEVNFKSNLDEVLPLIDTADKRALMEVGIAVQERAADNSPVRTGALRSSWTVEIDPDEQCVYIGVLEGDLEGDYAKFVELGTSKMQGRHMLKNAVESVMPLFEGIARTEFENA